MSAYANFAEVYDTFMDNVPYDEWAAYILEQLNESGVLEGLILELGCGTGSMAELFATKGYDIIGVDNSQEMLQIAMNKRVLSGHDILYLLQDMREFELYGTVRAIISVCDSINYILEPKELVDVFRLVNNYLDPDGIFIFDFNTTYKYSQVIGERIIAEEREACSFIWDNFYDEKSGVNEYDLTLFVQQEIDTQLYRKYQESHYQRGYTLPEIMELLEQSGLKFKAAYDGYTNNMVQPTSERICVIAKECGKTSKQLCGTGKE